VESSSGFIFDGTLSHAGACVDYPGCIESMVLHKVQAVVNKETTNAEETPETFEIVFNKLCNVKNLNKITRFHALIMPKDESIQHSPNSVSDIKKISEF
jgi:hypothetical protein